MGFIFMISARRPPIAKRLSASNGVPFIGGAAICLSFFITTLSCLGLHSFLSKEILGMLIASLLMFIFGVIDDLRELSVFLKFFTQVICAGILILFNIRTQIVYIGEFANIIITLIWVIAITNAFNHLDIIDGLAGGVTIIISLSFLAVSLLNNSPSMAIICLALLGGIVVFMLYNFPPAKIYMGNSGSHFLGFLFSAVALIISFAPMERKVALLSPVLILGFPIFDTAFVILMRLKQKRSIFKKSGDHLALRYIKIGHSKHKTLLQMLATALLFSVSGIAVSQFSNLFGIIIVIFVVVTGFIITLRMGKVLVED
jgi:UDP-GlcNAc:undecaprenyl-phosphate GlcNAc-1-phosphate transferase